MMKPIYFDLTVENVEQAKSFFSKVLDWEFEKFASISNYYRIIAGNEKDPGINGGIGSLNDTTLTNKPLTVITIQVSDITETLKKVKDYDGKIVEDKREIPNIGYYATCAEPGGLMFGIIQAKKS